MATHVAFVRKEIADKIRSGEKHIESRLSINRPPAWKTKVGDLLLFKEVGGEINLAADVTAVHKFEKLSPTDILSLAELFCSEMGTTPTNPYWQTKSGSRYAVFIEFANVTIIKFPRALTPKGVQSAWVANFREDFLARCLVSNARPDQAIIP